MADMEGTCPNLTSPTSSGTPPPVPGNSSGPHVLRDAALNAKPSTKQWCPPSVFRRPSKTALYVAAHYPDAAQALRVHDMLVRRGFVVTSTWYFPTASQDPKVFPGRCLNEVAKADAVVLLPTPHRSTGGKFIEVGFALGRGKTVYVVGHHETPMTEFAPGCILVRTIDEVSGDAFDRSQPNPDYA